MECSAYCIYMYLFLNIMIPFFHLLIAHVDFIVPDLHVPN